MAIVTQLSRLCYNKVMKIYFAGIGGSGLNPLANLALDLSFEVSGSDAKMSQNTNQLAKRGVKLSNNQNGDFLKTIHKAKAIDWFIYTSSLPTNHPELILAQKLGIKISKRDEFIAWLIKEHHLQLIAVAGTHGKTTTTTMLIWLFEQLKIAASHLVGSNLDFARAGVFKSNSQYFIYECDEYDRNFLHFYPDWSLIPSLDWDHVDIYPTQDNYEQAFSQFINQSQQVFIWPKDNRPIFRQTKINLATEINPRLTILGEHNRANAQLILDFALKLGFKQDQIIEALNQTPRPSRRFEPLKPNLISDYAHHPTEIQATLNLAQEYKNQHNFNKLIVIYQPHQNDRQRHFKQYYQQAFEQADQIYWLPTYLARGSEETAMTVTDFKIKATGVDLDNNFKKTIEQHLTDNDLIVAMTAGDLDDWLRSNFYSSKPKA